MSVAPSRCLICSLDDQRDPEYIPSGTQTPTPHSRVNRGTAKNVAPGVVSVSLSDEECILIGSPSKSASGSERASSIDKATGSKFAHSTGLNKDVASDSGSLGAPLPDVLAKHSLYDEAQNLEYTPESQHEVPAQVSHDPNRG